MEAAGSRGGVAVVTGAGSGIGRGIALGLAEAGFAVALLGRRADALTETAAGLATDGMVLPADVTRDDEVDEAFATVSRRWGRLDLLVNNAGRFGSGATVDELDPAVWRATVEVNLTGMFLCARAAFAAMRAQSPQGGRIINNGSISAQVPRPASAAYTASKHGVTGLTRAIALDGRPFDIRCSQLDIGNAGTQMTAVMEAGVAQADGSMRAEPTFDARHVAEIVVQLARMPLSVDVPFLTMTAAGMPFLGRG
jgi:NAD(P)-dependent dehydrogenase (short-subunit alcohol dehydrogenase family)